MFSSARVFSDRNARTGQTQWFFESREGVGGPYESKKIAEAELQSHIEWCQQQNIDGGRRLDLDRADKQFKLAGR